MALSVSDVCSPLRSSTFIAITNAYSCYAALWDSSSSSSSPLSFSARSVPAIKKTWASSLMVSITSSSPSWSSSIKLIPTLFYWIQCSLKWRAARSRSNFWFLLYTSLNKRYRKQFLKEFWMHSPDRTYHSSEIHFMIRTSMLQIELLSLSMFFNTRNSNRHQNICFHWQNYSGVEWLHLTCGIRWKEEHFHILHHRKKLSCAMRRTIFQEENNFAAWRPPNVLSKSISPHKKIKVTSSGHLTKVVFES